METSKIYEKYQTFLEKHAKELRSKDILGETKIRKD